MKMYTKRPFLFLLIAALLLVACGGGEEDTSNSSPIAVETSREGNEESAQAIAIERDAVEVEVTRVVTEIVTETVTETVIIEAEEVLEESYDSAADAEAPPAPLATAPASTSGESVVIPAPTVVPAATPSAMFFEEYGVNPYILTEVSQPSHWM